MTPAVPPPALPPGLLASPAQGPTWQSWLDALPRSLADLMADWALTPDGPAAHGRCALVLPVRDADFRPAALKLTWPHEQAEHDHRPPSGSPRSRVHHGA